MSFNFSPAASPRAAASSSTNVVVIDPNDTRPMSVQNLERTCVQLQSIVNDQDRVIKSLERSLGSAVTRAHVEMMLVGKVGAEHLAKEFGELGQELGTLLESKLNAEQAEDILASKAPRHAMDELRDDILTIKEAIRTGQGLEHLGDLASAAPTSAAAKQQQQQFARYQTQIHEAIKQLREEQDKMKRMQQEQEAVNAEESAASQQRQGRSGSSISDTSGPIHTGRFNADGSEILLNADGTLWTSSSSSGGGSATASSSSSSSSSSSWSESEKRLLRERVERMEMAIQMAGVMHRNGDSNDNGRGAGASSSSPRKGVTFDSSSSSSIGGGGGRIRDLEALEDILDSKYDRTQKAVEVLRAQCAKADEDIERMTRAVEAQRKKTTNQQRNAAAAASATNAYGGAGGNDGGGVTTQQLTHFMQELRTLQRDLASRSGGNGGGDGGGDLKAAQDLYERLSSEAAASSRMLVEVRDVLRGQVRARSRVLGVLDDARVEVGRGVGGLLGQVQALRHSLRERSDALRTEWTSMVRDQRRRVRELQEWKYQVERELEQAINLAENNAHQVLALQAPLADQLRAAQTTEVELREKETEKRFDKEYAQLRQRYEEARAKEDALMGRSPPRSPLRQRQEEKDYDYNFDEWTDDDGDAAADFATATAAAATATPSVPFTPAAGPASPSSSTQHRQRPMTSPRLLSGSSGRGSVTASPTARRRSWDPLLQPQQPQSSQQSQPSDFSPRARTAGRRPPSATPSAFSFSTSSTRASSAALTRPSAPTTTTTTTSSALTTPSAAATTTMRGYAPAPDSAFQAASPSAGPRWVAPATNTRFDSSTTTTATRPATCASSGRTLSPTSSPSSRPASSASMMLSRGGTMTPRSGAPSPRRPSSRGLMSPRGASAAPTATRFTAEHSEISQTLDLLRERLSMPPPSGGGSTGIATPFSPRSPLPVSPRPPTRQEHITPSPPQRLGIHVAISRSNSTTIPPPMPIATALLAAVSAAASLPSPSPSASLPPAVNSSGGPVSSLDPPPGEVPAPRGLTASSPLVSPSPRTVRTAGTGSGSKSSRIVTSVGTAMQQLKR